MSHSAPPRKSSYAVKSVETIAAGTDVRVRLFTLAPGEIVPWHHHSQCSDQYFVLEGALTVETRNPESLHVVETGAGHQLWPGMPHQISNRAKADSSSCKALALLIGSRSTREESRVS